ncbi:MAG: rod shape-determining protein MreC [Deltaproteobacteria bacterium]|nr:rod shape-determining protein MreC [Deltaproteobacteria bacterium]
MAGLLSALALGTVVSGAGADRVRSSFTSLQGEVAAGADGARRAWARHLRTTAVADSLHNLERDQDRLRMEVLHLRGLDAERRRLAHLLQMRDRHGLEAVSAHVVARGGGGRQTLRLDVGAEHGIGPRMAVLGARGVVGQVLDTGTGWTDVLALTDPTHGFAGVLETGHHGTLRGTGLGLAMDHVLARTEVVSGSLVTSSGEGGVFPPGLPVGRVASLTPEVGTPFLMIEVRPLAPPELLDEVLVVTGRADESELAIR